MKQYKIKVNDSDMYLVTALSEADAVARVSKIHNKFKNGVVKDAGFDAKYAEHQRKLDAEVRRAKELYKISDGRYDYNTLFKQVFNYTSRGDRLTQLTKTVGDYTYVIYLNNNRILYCVWDKSGNIPKGWCPTVTMYDEYTIKDTSYYEPGDDTKDLYQISYKRNGVYQSILVKANSEEQAKQKLLNHKNGVDIIGINSNPSPHFHEPIID